MTTRITRKTGCTPRRPERRVFPPRGSWSTRDYVAAYFEINTDQPGLRYAGHKVHAYDRARFVNHGALYQPLSTRTQEWPADVIVEGV